jgi:hypothetical protein
MCSPLAIAGVALSIGSTVANTIAANKVDKARADAMAAERIRQGKLDQENAALNETSRDRYTDFGGQQEESASKLGDYFTENEAMAAQNDQQAVDAMLPTSGSKITVQEAGKQSNLAKAFTDQQGEALGKLRSFGDVLGGIGREQARDAGSIGQINSFKRASSGIVPLELEAANSAGNGMKLFGDILGMGGSIMMNGGLKGGPGVNYFPSVPTRPTVSSSGLW